MIKQTLLITSIVVMLLLLLTTSIGLSPTLADGQPMRTNRTTTPTISKTNPLSVLLIHGYFEDASVWNRWEQLLSVDHITYRTVTFGQPYYDACGSAQDHANQLNAIIQEMKRATGQNQVNIVDHSKGGLDARVYLANNIASHDVANIIMIGTPNTGSPLADISAGTDPCCPAIYDLVTSASDIHAVMNSNTNY